MDSVKLGLVGAGTIGARHIEAIDDVGEATLRAIADPSPAAAAIGGERGIPVHADAESMFQAGGIDAVVIATPTERHHRDVMTALDHRLTVLVEKPIMATMAEAREVTSLAKKRGCNVLVGHQRRYYPCAGKAREIIQSGRIGKLMAVAGQWTTRKDDPYYEPEWRQRKDAGPILTNLIHEIDLLRHICGEIEAVSAETANHDQNFDKEDAVSITMKFANGAVGGFVLSDRAPSPWTWEAALGESARFPKSGQNAVRFMGTKGSLEFPNLVLWSYPDGGGSWLDEIRPETVEAPFVDAYAAQCRHLCAVVRGAETPIIDAEDATRSLDATLAAARAAEKGGRVVLKHR